MSGSVIEISRLTYERMDYLHKLDVRIKVREGKMRIVEGEKPCP